MSKSGRLFGGDATSKVVPGLIGMLLLLTGTCAVAGAIDSLASAEVAHRQFLTGDVAAAQSTLEVALSQSPSDPRLLFEQGIVHDAMGRHAEARAFYDKIGGTSLRQAIAVPSAVNLVSLGRYDQARQAFDLIANGSNEYEAGYAQLWQMWLTARTYDGEASSLRLRLQAMAQAARPATPSQKAIVDLFEGYATVDEVFAQIERMSVANERQRLDARTEAAFFSGAYLQYAREDIRGARDLFDREYPVASTASVERPLIAQARAALP